MSARLRHIPRYAEIAWVLWKYGREIMSSVDLPRDWAQPAGVESEDPEPEQLAEDLERLGATFVKLGQLLSTRSDLIPERYLEALTRLQDEVSPLSFEEVEGVLQQSLGTRASKTFAEFDRRPLASASLSQVHAARLPDGRQVAVKIQRPGARRQVVEDLEILEDLAELLAERWDTLDLPGLVHELRRTLMSELDFQRESMHLRRMREQLSAHPEIVVPQPVDEYTSSRVLTMQFISGRKVTELDAASRTDIDGSRLAAVLFQAYLESILVDGMFHADPHPGNVLVTDDGRIALLDLGMVGQLSLDFQEKLLRLLLALSEGSGSEAADAAIRLGRPTERFDEQRFRGDVEVLARRLSSQSVGDLQIGSVVLEVTKSASECGIRMPREFLMLGKTLLNLDRIGLCLAPDFDPNAAIRRHAVGIAQGQMVRSLSPSSWLARLLELKELVSALPERLNRVSEALSEGRFRLTVDAIDEGLLVRGFQKVANRIATGLILAALIVGAALIMRVPSDYQILGYPALAVVLFLAATVGGIGLMWSIWRSDR